MAKVKVVLDEHANEARQAVSETRVQLDKAWSALRSRGIDVKNRVNGALDTAAARVNQAKNVVDDQAAGALREPASGDLREQIKGAAAAAGR